MQEVIPPARETKFREEAPWFLMKPVDETPYVISKSGGVESGWIPPFGISALPEVTREKIPKEFQYWKEKVTQKRKKIRDELVNTLGDKLIEKVLNPGEQWAKAAYYYVLAQQQLTIWMTLTPEQKISRVRENLQDFSHIKPFKSAYRQDAIAWLERRPNEIKEMIINSLEIEKSRNVKFTLQWHFFRGQKVIRAGVTQQHWDLRLDFPNQKELMHFVLNQNPLKNREITALWKPCPYKEWMNISQYLPPKNEREKMSATERAKLPKGIEEANPTLNTPSYIKIIDRGTVVVLEDSDIFKKFHFKGEKLKGLWIFEREGMSEFWIMKISEVPHPQ